MLINLTNTNFGHSQSIKKKICEKPSNTTMSDSNLMLSTLLALAMLGSTMVTTTSCSHSNSPDDFTKTEEVALIPNGAVDRNSMDDYKTATEKANFLFHELGIIDKNKKIADIKELSFTNSQGEKYVFNDVGEYSRGVSMSGIWTDNKGKQKEETLEMSLINGDGDKLYIGDLYNKTHSNSIIYQAGWRYEDGDLKPVFYEERVARSIENHDKTNGFSYDKNNTFEISKIGNSIISTPLPNTKPYTGSDLISNITVSYRTED